jgi:hypothetical protein
LSEKGDWEALTDMLVQLVRSANCRTCVIWAKQDDVVRRVAAAIAGSQLQLRLGAVMMSGASAAHSGLDRPLRLQGLTQLVGAHYPLATQELAKLVHGAGMQLWVWTVNEVRSGRVDI